MRASSLASTFVDVYSFHDGPSNSARDVTNPHIRRCSAQGADHGRGLDGTACRSHPVLRTAGGAGPVRRRRSRGRRAVQGARRPPPGPHRQRAGDRGGAGLRVRPHAGPRVGPGHGLVPSETTSRRRAHPARAHGDVVLLLTRTGRPVSGSGGAPAGIERRPRMNEMRETVRERYAEAALSAADGATCCGDGCGCGEAAGTTFGAGLYGLERSDLPEAAVLASMGCGNPTAVAELREGETVLDLGSGGGIDVLLSARRVGPAGKAYGLDMTDEMLALARENQRKAGATNVEFLKGTIEAIPLPDNAVDVIISNCVINLSSDKDAVLREAFRVLKPGGRFAVSDVVVEGEIPEGVRKDMEAYVGCVA